MTLQQVGQLLTLIAMNDNRAWTPETALVWHEILGELDYDAAVSAMYAHFRESTDYLTPAHIVARVKHANPERPTTMSPETTECAPGDHRWMPNGSCLFCTARRERPAVESSRRAAPRPENFDAMAAAANDPVKWAAEIARYNEQLQAAGFAPVNSQLRR